MNLLAWFMIKARAATADEQARIEGEMGVPKFARGGTVQRGSRDFGAMVARTFLPAVVWTLGRRVGDWIWRGIHG